MLATLSIPNDYGDAQLDFGSKKGEITDEQFVKEFRADYDKHRMGIDYMMHTRFGKNVALNQYEKENNKFQHTKFHYNEIDCHILNVQGVHETIDNLIKYFQSAEQFALMLRFVNINDHPDIETDMREWFKTSDKINKSPRLTQHEKMANLPKKDLRIQFKNAQSNAILKGCKVLAKNKTNEYIIIVEKIIFVVNK